MLIAAMLSVVAPIKSFNKSKKVLKHDRSYIKIFLKNQNSNLFSKLFYKIVQKNDENLGFYFRRGSHLPRKHFKNRLGVQSKSDQVKIQWSDHDKAQPPRGKESRDRVLTNRRIFEFVTLSIPPRSE